MLELSRGAKTALLISVGLLSLQPAYGDNVTAHHYISGCQDVTYSVDNPEAPQDVSTPCDGLIGGPYPSPGVLHNNDQVHTVGTPDHLLLHEHFDQSMQCAGCGFQNGGLGTYGSVSFTDYLIITGGTGSGWLRVSADYTASWSTTYHDITGANAWMNLFSHSGTVAVPGGVDSAASGGSITFADLPFTFGISRPYTIGIQGGFGLFSGNAQAHMEGTMDGSLTGWSFVVLNADGDPITGATINGDSGRIYGVTQVPEPTLFAELGALLLGLTAALRFKKRFKSAK